MKRYGSVVRLRPEKEAEYRRLHAAAWPEVLDRLSRSNIHNFSIFLRDGLLFSYYEHDGEDHDADVAAIAADPRTQEWWALTDPCQQRWDTCPESQWAPMEEVFHHD